MDPLEWIWSYVEGCEENNRAQGRGTLRAVERFIKIHANGWKCAKMDPGHPQVVTDLTSVIRVGVIFLLFKFVRNTNMLFYNSGENHLYFKTKQNIEKTLKSPLDSKEIKPVSPKGNQPWVFIGRTDAATEAPILWPPDVKSQLIGKDPDTGKDGG